MALNPSTPLPLYASTVLPRCLSVCSTVTSLSLYLSLRQMLSPLLLRAVSFRARVLSVTAATMLALCTAAHCAAAAPGTASQSASHEISVGLDSRTTPGLTITVAGRPSTVDPRRIRTKLLTRLRFDLIF